MEPIDWNKAKVDRLANFGHTAAGSAIVDAIWFTQGFQQVGMVLILNPEGAWKCYVGVADLNAKEKDGARWIAQWGSKLPVGIAMGAFPGRFAADDYDC